MPTCFRAVSRRRDVQRGPHCAGYTGTDCSSCDPTYFSINAPEWGKNSYMCSLTDSKTSFIGVEPTPPGAGPSQSGNSAVDTLLNPKFLGIVGGGFLLLLVIMVSVICYIRRGPSSRKLGEPVYPLAMSPPGADDNESVASGSTPAAVHGSHYDSLHLAHTGRTAKSYSDKRHRGAAPGPSPWADRPSEGHGAYDRERSYTLKQSYSQSRGYGHSSHKYSGYEGY
jgi:hypothetical protein